MKQLIRVLAHGARIITFAAPAFAFEPLRIQDNSFLLEEAYNQEHRVVQHILGLMRDENGDVTGTFTQEWPAGGQAHQLSVTLGIDEDTDSLINYRYQLIGTGETRLAVSPRLSLIVGSRRDRDLGVQANLPVSYALSDTLVTHWNAGATAVRGDTTFSGGASVIWAARPKLHLMLENVWESGDSALVVSPGIRWAHDFKSGLQIVPGIAVPIDTRNGSRAVFAYVSFEHPF